MNAAHDRYATVFLGIAGFVFLATGATFVIAPGLVPAVHENPAASTDAINDARAIYGAMEFAIGAFLAFCAPRPRLHEAGFLAALLVGGFAALSRFVGFAVLAGTPTPHLAYGALDGVGALFAFHGLRRLAARAAAG